MIAYQDYKATLKKSIAVEMIAMLLLLRPELKNRLQQEKNVVRLRALLEAERSNKLIFREKLVIEVIESSMPVFLRPKTENYNFSQEDYRVQKEAEEYWEALPPVLQQKLIEAGDLTMSKRNLSNSLYGALGNEVTLAEIVRQINAHSLAIDEIYNAKRQYDKYGVLPDAWVDKLDKLGNDKEALKIRLQSVQRMIREYKAKLNNPTEVEKATEQRVKKWRESLADFERELSEIKQKFVQLG